MFSVFVIVVGSDRFQRWQRRPEYEAAWAEGLEASHKGNKIGAAIAFSKCIALIPTFQATAYLGEALTGLEAHEEAIWFLFSARFDARWVDARSSAAIGTLLARVYLRTGKLDEAIKASEEVIRLLPDRRDELLADARLTRGLAKLQSRDVPGAKQDFQWVLDHGDAEHQRFAQSFLVAGRLVEVAGTGMDEFWEYGKKLGDLWRNRN
jgi:tetratricopeptide (TPR) repeat protein